MGWLPFSTCVVLLIGASAIGGELTPVVAGPEGQRAFDELGAYYRDKDKRPDYRWALDRIHLFDPAAQRQAYRYLLALLRQSAADEANGRAGWDPPRMRIDGYRSATWDLRRDLASDLGRQAGGPEALELATWLAEEGRLSCCREAGAQILRRIRDPRVTAVFQRLLARPASDRDVSAAVVEEAGLRGLTELAPTVRQLCTHYRTAVRKAARAAAPKLGIDPLPPFRPEDAFTPWLGEQLERIASMVLTDIPADARWVHVEFTNQDYRIGDKPVVQWFGGWLLGESETEYRVLDWFADRRSLPKGDTKLETRAMLDEAKALVGLRKRLAVLDRERQEAKGLALIDLEEQFDRTWAMLSRDGYATAQFEPRFLVLPEILLSAWAFVRGEKRAAATVLFPRMDALARDEWLVGIAADYLGHHYHEAMLGAFVHARDYPEAVRFARHVAKPLFASYRYHERAQEVAEQLGQRLDEWKSLTLPEKDAWPAVKRTMSRHQQIDYLAKRLRMLNTPQCSQPGSVNYTRPIPALSSIEWRRLWDADQRPEDRWLINPYVELLRMDIRLDELHHLVPYLADRSFIPAYGYWRLFHPARTLHRVNWAVAEIIDIVAMQDLADLETCEDPDEAGRKQHIAKLLAWCKANAGKTRTQLAVELMRRAKEPRDFLRPAVVAARAKSVEALPLLIGRVPALPEHRGDVAELCYRIDTPQAVAHARKWVADEETAVRFWGALILLRHGDRANLEGLDVLRAVLDPPKPPARDAGEELVAPDEGEEPAGEPAEAPPPAESPWTDEDLSWYPYAIDDLLATGRDEAAAVACTILKKDRAFWFDTVAPPILHRLFLAGRKECLDYLLAKLDSEKPIGSEPAEEGEPRRVQGDKAVDLVWSWRTDDFDYDWDAPLEERRRKRRTLKAWLQGSFQRIRAGQTPRLMKTKPLPLAHISSSGWYESVPPP